MVLPCPVAASCLYCKFISLVYILSLEWKLPGGNVLSEENPTRPRLLSHTLQPRQPPLPYTVICTPEQKVGLFLPRLFLYVFLSEWRGYVTLPADTLRGDQTPYWFQGLWQQIALGCCMCLLVKGENEGGCKVYTRKVILESPSLSQ